MLLICRMRGEEMCDRLAAEAGRVSPAEMTNKTYVFDHQTAGQYRSFTPYVHPGLRERDRYR
jgi:hypothetical protein